MKFTLVLGFPRSGTSLVAKVIEKLGFPTNIEEYNNLDRLYKVNHPFNQRRDIHIFLASLGVGNMKMYTSPIPLEMFEVNKSSLIKEPYLLFVLDQIREFVLNIVLVIRNPNEVVASCGQFFNDNGQARKIRLDEWNNYYILFMKHIGNIPYTVVNYNEMIKNPAQTIDNLKLFLSSNVELNIDIGERTHKSNICLPADTMYIYNCVTNMIPIDNLKVIDTSINAKCFCESGKKYKKCHALIFNKS